MDGVADLAGRQRVRLNNITVEAASHKPHNASPTDDVFVRYLTTWPTWLAASTQNDGETIRMKTVDSDTHNPQYSQTPRTTTPR